MKRLSPRAIITALRYSHWASYECLNCHGLNSAVASYIRSSLAFADCVLLQETWLSNQTSSRLNDFFSESYSCFHSSAMEEKLSSSVYNGRPFGGTGILVRNHLSKFVMPVATGSPRVTALRLFNVRSQDIVVCSIYMPCLLYTSPSPRDS